MATARHSIVFLIATALALTLAGQADGPVSNPSTAADSPAPPARLATEGLLLDLARAGSRIVAVGDHGIVVLSDDEGVTWRQASVPVQSMLTAVAFAGPETGWAAGHGGLILATRDGGESWDRLDPPTTEDDSFLDLLALGPRHVIAVGAYGLFCETRDGGATWELRSALEEDMHINRLFRTRTGRILLAGESGTLAFSSDEGGTWETLAPPYEGSFYGFFELSSGRWLIHGLRGHVFTSDDHGGEWRQAEIEHKVLLMAGLETDDGTIVLSGLGGWAFVSTDNGDTFRTVKPDSLTATAELLPSGPDGLIYAGVNGVKRLAMP